MFSFMYISDSEMYIKLNIILMFGKTDDIVIIIFNALKIYR